MNRRKHPDFKEPVTAAPQYLRLHKREPDFDRSKLEVRQDKKKAILEILTKVYGEETAAKWYPEIERIMRVHYATKYLEMIEEDRAFEPANRFTEKDIILITYGDLIVRSGARPLEVLSEILEKYARYVTTVHILPFFPYSSDRGFSIVSYYSVDPKLGTWEDISRLSTRFKVMFDGVINHVSSKSRWFQEYLNGNPDFDDFFIRFTTESAISKDHMQLILRPRTSNLLTRVQSIDGPKFVWTTFSPDQIDLNYKNIKVLIKVLDVLFFYVRRGADIIRLDAVTYLWSELGTSCAHLEQTHLLIKLFRLVLDVVAPQVALITETNVPHEDNVRYFGDGGNEAQMIYNFALPPLVLHAFITGNCRRLSRWAADLEQVSDTATYFNFLDSHDGIGLLGVTGFLSGSEIEEMIRRMKEHGGMLSYRTDMDGKEIPYELNITWFSALNKPGAGEPPDLQIDRFIASRSISFALRGVPGIYLLSMIGRDNDIESVITTGDKRSINRTAINADDLEVLLEDRSSRTHKIFVRTGILFSVRVHCPAFHPNGRQIVITDNDKVFSVVRISPDGKQTILCLTNVTNAEQEFELRWDHLENWPAAFENLFTGNVRKVEGGQIAFKLKPYQVKWLEALEEYQE
jgi:glycosidase